MADGGRRATPGERVRRLLVAVPHIVANPGIAVDDVARRFAIPRDELLADLELLNVTGKPPLLGGDLMDVEIDEEGGVTIRSAYFDLPVAMTRPEALSLFLRARAAATALPEGSALHGAVEKLRAVLGDDTSALETMPLDVPAVLDVLSAAADERGVCRITYHALSTGERTEREIEPEEVFLALGAWYVDAWDRLRDEERLFRIDRIAAAERTGETFAERGLRGSDRPLYRPATDDVPVRIRLAPPARWVAEYYVVQDRVEEGPDLVVTLRVGRREWLLRLLLRLGADATVLEPEAVRDEVRELAREMLARYRAHDR